MANPRSGLSQFADFQMSGSGSYPSAPAGAFGTRVAPVAPITPPVVVAPPPVTPFDRNAAVVKVAPMQPQVSGAAWQAAQDMLGGGVTAATQRYIRDRAAALGVNLGAAGADWTTNNALIGEIGTSEDRVKAGLAAYNALLSGTQNLVTDPTQVNLSNRDAALNTALANAGYQDRANMANNEIEQWNNTNAAAPDPAAAAQYQQQLFDQQVKLLSQAYRSPAAGLNRGVTSGTPQYASVASPPNLTAPGFAPQSGLLNSATFSNGIYNGGVYTGNQRTSPASTPTIQPSDIRQWGGGGTGSGTFYAGSADYAPGMAPEPTAAQLGYDPALEDWLQYME